MSARLTHAPFSGVGFTLVELIVVVVVMGVTIGLVVPRVGALSSRRESADVSAVEELLDTMASRAALGGAAARLRIVREDARLDPLVRTSEAWVVDRLVRGVTLTRVRIESVAIDGEEIPIRDEAWAPIGGNDGARTLAITLAPRSGAGGTWIVFADLTSGRVERARGEAAIFDARADDGSVVDLDALGRGEEVW